MGARVKICGVANASDAEAVAALKPDFMGFIFWPGSKRCVKPEDVRDWIAKIPSTVKKVGVFVDATPGEVRRVMELARLDIVQLHGGEERGGCQVSGVSLPGQGCQVSDFKISTCGLWQVVKIAPSQSQIENFKSQISEQPPESGTRNPERSISESQLPILGKTRDEHFQSLEVAACVDAMLLDTYSPTAHGGTGETGDWNVAREFVGSVKKPVLLAGGLTPANVAEAIRIVKPWGVDVSSGVEERPGKKDLNKVKEFIHAARNN